MDPARRATRVTGRTTQIIGFSVPPAVVKEVETLAKQEQRTKSELFREMLRVYRRYREQRDGEDRWIMNLIEQTKAEQARNPMSAEEMIEQSKRLAEYGEQQAKKLGIKADMRNIVRIIHAHRKAGRL